MAEVAYQNSKITRTALKFLNSPKEGIKADSSDLELLLALERVKKELDCVHNCLDSVTDEMLIDSYIYQIKALQMKFTYYTQLCKERGITVDFY